MAQLAELFLTGHNEFGVSTTDIQEAFKESVPGLQLLEVCSVLNDLDQRHSAKGQDVAVSHRPGSKNAPHVRFCLRWKSADELLKSAVIVIVCAMEIEYEALVAKLVHSIDTSEAFTKSIANASIGITKGWPTLIVRTREFGSVTSYAATEQVIEKCEKMQELLKCGMAAFQLPDPFSPRQMVSKGDIAILWCSQSDPIIKAFNMNSANHDQNYTRQELNVAYTMRQWKRERNDDFNGAQILKTRLQTGKYYQHELQEIEPGFLAEMEVAGMAKAITLYSERQFSFAVLSVISEVFLRNEVIDRFENDGEKWPITEVLASALEDYLDFKKADASN